MMFKTFKASSLAEVFRQVREAFGPDAVVVSTKASLGVMRTLPACVARFFTSVIVFMAAPGGTKIRGIEGRSLARSQGFWKRLHFAGTRLSSL